MVYRAIGSVREEGLRSVSVVDLVALLGAVDASRVAADICFGEATGALQCKPAKNVATFEYLVRNKNKALIYPEMHRCKLRMHERFARGTINPNTGRAATIVRQENSSTTAYRRLD